MDEQRMTCIFCAIIAGDAPGHFLFQDDNVIALLSLEGHPLVVPRRHFPGLEDLDDATAAAVFQCARTVAGVVRAATGCEGINLVLSDGPAAGQDVFHLHLHVKPRWNGDTVRLTWNTATVPDADRAALAASIRTRLPTQAPE
jgi:histidine triad (HIT) family protein